MEFKVEHPNFVENKIVWEISGLKSVLKYNGNPVKLKWGKTKLIDDQGIEREVKITDNFFNSPMIVIDKNEKIKIMENYSKIAYFFIIPSFFFLIKGGVLGAVFAVANIYFVRNTFLTNKSLGTKIALSLLSTVGGIVALFVIAMIFTILIRGF
ncbi:hypothetical protein [Fusobacterium sp.]|uniref:hypothetical protein n=1 Tax=Fusobacterium sp. TaxID=68766 RepID=UPI0029045099|nr:hypothetical protein [Fusobacterium sp.]MDU1911336.1 hypothetical protein [Fusobacterium sp.]